MSKIVHTQHTIEEGENADGWGFLIKDDGGRLVRRVWHAHNETRTDELKASSRRIAEEEKHKLDNPGIPGGGV